MCASEGGGGGEAMDFETLSFFFTKLFQTVCSVCLTIQTQFISYSSRGLWFHFNFLSFFFFFFNMQGILPASAGVRVTAQVFPAEEKKGHCLWQRTKTFRIAVTQPSLNTPIFRPCWLHSKWTIIMLDSAA